MVCGICNETDILRVEQPLAVRFYCKQGHSWSEEYEDNGGVHPRPISYQTDLEDTLFPDDKLMLKRLLSELRKDLICFTKSSPEAIIEHLVMNADFERKPLLLLFKKIHEFSKSTGKFSF